jgi:NADH:ubiquinone oxidoreductase subunit 5 (subunit L)/multisubunit Na+/H+ antiporter MnhA subunit
MFAYYEWLVLILPLLGALLNAFLGQRFSRRAQSWVANGAILGALLVTLPLLAGQTMEPGLVGKPTPLPWIKIWAGDRLVEGPLALRVDALSITMALTVLTVGLFIHLFAAQHLRQGPSRPVTLALLNSTLLALLLLVLADHFFPLLLGWSLAGLSAYGLVQTQQDDLPPAHGKKDTLAKRTQAPKRGPGMLAFFLLSDLCLLLAIGVMSEQFASVSLDHVTAMEPFGLAGPPLPTELSIMVALLFGSAAIRVALLLLDTEHIDGIAGAAWYALSGPLPSIYLLARVHPLIAQTSFGPTLLSWWGIVYALCMAFAALVQSAPHRLIRLAASSQAGLLVLALGQRAHPVALSFLPAYALLQGLISLSSRDVPRTARDHTARAMRSPETVAAHSGMQWRSAFGLVASVGLPPLPGFAFNGQILEATFGASKGLWILTLLTVLLLSASAVRAVLLCKSGASAPSLSGRGLFFTMAALSVVLGALNLTSPPPVGRFLEPVLRYGGYQPPWWWFGIATIIAGLGAGLGYWLHPLLRQSQSKMMTWMNHHEAIQNAYSTAIVRPLLAIGQFIAHSLEGRMVRWMLGAVAHWSDDSISSDEKPNAPTYLILLFFFLGVTLIVAYLLL